MKRPWAKLRTSISHKSMRVLTPRGSRWPESDAAKGEDKKDVHGAPRRQEVVARASDRQGRGLRRGARLRMIKHDNTLRETPHNAQVLLNEQHRRMFCCAFENSSKLANEFRGKSLEGSSTSRSGRLFKRAARLKASAVGARERAARWRPRFFQLGKEREDFVVLDRCAALGQTEVLLYVNPEKTSRSSGT